MLAPKLTLFESAGAVGAQRRQLDEHLPLTSSTHLVHPLTQLRKKLPLCNNARYQIWYTPSGASPLCCETTPTTGPVTLCSFAGAEPELEVLGHLVRRADGIELKP